MRCIHIRGWLFPSRKVYCFFSLLLSVISIIVIAPEAQAQGVQNNAPFTNPAPDIVPLFRDAVNATNRMDPCSKLPIAVRCYTPQQIRSIYGIQPLLAKGITGKGETIVMIDFYQNPWIKRDLAYFSRLYNLKPARLNVIAPFGSLPFNPLIPENRDSALEIDLDVEWAHAIAPDATLDLVLSRTSSSEDIYDATRYAIANNLGSVISQSFGGSETCLGETNINEEHRLFELAQEKHISVLASAGDSGTSFPVCNENGQVVSLGPAVSYPASDPLVTSVGGTHLIGSNQGKYISETTWNNSTNSQIGGATGGGFSEIFPRPAYQSNIKEIGNMRGMPDIAYDADPHTGFPIVTSALVRGLLQIIPVGGTSAGSPQWAGIVALLNQYFHAPLGELNPLFYNILKGSSYRQGFHDITTGNNATPAPLPGPDLTLIAGYNAGSGWDPTTGMGTPDAIILKKILSLSRTE